MTNASDTDRIERSILINASRERVFRALSTPDEFGTWFGARLEGQEFAPGKRARGPITIPGYEQLFFDALFERIEPHELLSFRWTPYPIDTAADYSTEEPTLVTFTLKDAPGKATLLTVVETGFDKLPQHRRREAFEMNSGGWEGQLRNVAKYVSQ